MTTKEEAVQLYEDFYRITQPGRYSGDGHERAKQCALKCVDKIIEIAIENHNPLIREHWKQVRAEIKNMAMIYLDVPILCSIFGL